VGGLIEDAQRSGDKKSFPDGDASRGPFINQQEDRLKASGECQSRSLKVDQLRIIQKLSGRIDFLDPNPAG